MLISAHGPTRAFRSDDTMSAERRRCIANDYRDLGPTCGANPLAVSSNVILVVESRLGPFLDALVLVEGPEPVEIDPSPTGWVSTVDSGLEPESRFKKLEAPRRSAEVRWIKSSLLHGLLCTLDSGPPLRSVRSGDGASLGRFSGSPVDEFVSVPRERRRFNRQK